MVRIGDRIWNHVEKTDEFWKCRFCDHVFAKGIAAQIVKCHLAGVGGPGTKFCSDVPGHVKIEARREINEGEKKRRIIMSTSPSSSSNVTVEVSPKNDGERTIEQETKLRSRDGGGVERESDQKMIEPEFPAVMVKNGDSVCEICRHVYERRTPAKRRQWHLADIGGSGDTICTSMPDDVKGATLREITESKSKKRKTVPGSNHSEDVPTMSIEDVAVQPLEAGWSGFTKALEDLPNEADHGVRDEKMVEVEDASVKDSREKEITGVPPGDLMQPTEKDHEQSGGRKQKKEFGSRFRFYPTEEELISFYLQNKLDGRREDLNRIVNQLIPVLDVYEFNPWDLPRVAGEVSGRGVSDWEQWFFFVPRQENVGRGGRPNRLTSIGYWKATGMPGFVCSSTNNRSIGEKRTMVFYVGKAPNGRKTEWKMNEYKALANDAQNSSSTNISHPKLREEYCLCRIYKKTKCVRAFDGRPTGPAGPGVIMSEVVGTQKPPFDHHHAAITPTQQHMTMAEGDYSTASSLSSGEQAQDQPSQTMDSDDAVDSFFFLG